MRHGWNGINKGKRLTWHGARLRRRRLATSCHDQSLPLLGNVLFPSLLGNCGSRQHLSHCMITLQRKYTFTTRNPKQAFKNAKLAVKNSKPAVEIPKHTVAASRTSKRIARRQASTSFVNGKLQTIQTCTLLLHSTYCDVHVIVAATAHVVRLLSIKA